MKKKDENNKKENEEKDDNSAKTIFKEIIDKAINNPTEIFQVLQADLNMPNVPTKTLGGHTFWDTLVEYKGYKLQQNLITKHARILDSDNVRIAWGTINGMKKALERKVEIPDEYANKNFQNRKKITSIEQELSSAKKLFDNGIISSEEFNTIKKKLLDQVM